MFKVSVFGSAGPLPDSKDYKMARQLGNMLGKAGYGVMTGGYSGTMEAASLGANEAGGHVIGVTCNEIERWRATTPNPWVREEIRWETLQERLLFLIDECDAAIALGGGIGTLAEIVLMWNKMQVKSIPVKPLILVGKEWKEIFSMVLNLTNDFIRSEHKKLILFADEPVQAFNILQNMLKKP